MEIHQNCLVIQIQSSYFLKKHEKITQKKERNSFESHENRAQPISH